MFALGAMGFSGCVTGQLAGDAANLVEPVAGGATVAPGSAGASGAAVAQPHAGANASGGSGSSVGAIAGAAGTLVGMAGAPSAGASNGGAGGMPGMAGSAGMLGTAGAPPAPCPNKRGVAYAFGANSAGPDMNALKAGVGWFYGWTTGVAATAKPVYAAANMEFVPMIWNGSFKVADAVNAIPAGAKYLLGFNEPNFGSQANLTAAKAAELWPQIEQIAAQKQLQIVSPATNYCAGNCNATDPFVWLDDFFKACPTCKVDYVGVHWYACSVDALKDHVTKMKKYNKPLWVTEFACADGGPWSVDQVKAYAIAATAWLEQEPSVFRYSWYALLGDSGALTAVGTAYVNQPHQPCP